MSSLNPFLRSLLFTDGTVTRALEAQTLATANVEVRDQTIRVTPALAASCLCIPTGTHSIQRRVSISIEQVSNPVLWAESHILPGRLPTGFMDSLDSNPGGIGDSLQRAKLEGWRDLLWFGLAPQPDWTFSDSPSRTPTTVMTRLYRVITHDRPALLISESFPVERQHGEYRLFGL